MCFCSKSDQTKRNFKKKSLLWACRTSAPPEFMPFMVRFRSGAVVKRNLEIKLAYNIDFGWLADFYFILFEATKLQDEHSHTLAGL